VRVEIWSDVICPWCYIGKRRFEQALSSFAGADDVEVVFRPYQLDPSAPWGSTTPVKEAYARKFGGPERAEQIMSHLTDVARQSGLEFHLDRARRANTALAHRLLWAAEHAGPGVQYELKERLLRAYFTDGADVADISTLATLAAQAGLDAAVIEQVLHGTLGLNEVQAELDRARELGISAVPAFSFDGSWPWPGAQEPHEFLRLLQRAEARAQQASQAGTCDDDSCAI
jgi:predicted DsbA family dithiol-disulfide isomerase